MKTKRDIKITRGQTVMITDDLDAALMCMRRGWKLLHVNQTDEGLMYMVAFDAPEPKRKRKHAR